MWVLKLELKQIFQISLYLIAMSWRCKHTFVLGSGGIQIERVDDPTSGLNNLSNLVLNNSSSLSKYEG